MNNYVNNQLTTRLWEIDKTLVNQLDLILIERNEMEIGAVFADP